MGQIRKSPPPSTKPSLCDLFPQSDCVTGIRRPQLWTAFCMRKRSGPRKTEMFYKTSDCCHLKQAQTRPGSEHYLCCQAQDIETSGFLSRVNTEHARTAGSTVTVLLRTCSEPCFRSLWGGGTPTANRKTRQHLVGDWRCQSRATLPRVATSFSDAIDVNLVRREKLRTCRTDFGKMFSTRRI
jgi:hypothetical protein